MPDESSYDDTLCTDDELDALRSEAVEDLGWEGMEGYQDEIEGPSTVENKWQLEEWFLESGEAAERAFITGEPLSPIQSLIREFWVFDIHTQNGGVSQYFCNHGLDRWRALHSAWMPKEVPSLGPILAGIDAVIAGSPNPYVATLNASPGIENLYEAHQLDVKRELWRLEEAN